MPDRITFDTDQWVELYEPEELTVRGQNTLRAALAASYMSAVKAGSDPTAGNWQSVMTAEADLIVGAVVDWSLLDPDGSPLPVEREALLGINGAVYQAMSHELAEPIKKLVTGLNVDFGFVPKAVGARAPSGKSTASKTRSGA